MLAYTVIGLAVAAGYYFYVRKVQAAARAGGASAYGVEAGDGIKNMYTVRVDRNLTGAKQFFAKSNMESAVLTLTVNGNVVLSSFEYGSSPIKFQAGERPVARILGPVVYDDGQPRTVAG